MTMTDPIADMLTRIRNALGASHESVDVPYSNLKANVVKILKSEGYIRNFRVVGEEPRKVLRILLKYEADRRPVITGLKRVSKPSRRIYSGCEDIPEVLSGYGIQILSTPKGVLSDREARRMHVGGEILCSVW